MDTAHYSADCVCIHLARIEGGSIKTLGIGCAQCQLDSAETKGHRKFPSPDQKMSVFFNRPFLSINLSFKIICTVRTMVLRAFI